MLKTWLFFTVQLLRFKNKLLRVWKRQCFGFRILLLWPQTTLDFHTNASVFWPCVNQTPLACYASIQVFICVCVWDRGMRKYWCISTENRLWDNKCGEAMVRQRAIWQFLAGRYERKGGQRRIWCTAPNGCRMFLKEYKAQQKTEIHLISARAASITGKGVPLGGLWRNFLGHMQTHRHSSFYLSPFFPGKYSQITNASPCQQGPKIGERWPI